jgi:hypothetical protein
MEPIVLPATATITVFTRHSPDCPKKDVRYWKRYTCRKALYIYEDGRDRTISAKTRSWAKTDEFAKSEQAERDPLRRKLRQVEAKEEEKRVAASTKNITVTDALNRWIAGLNGRRLANSKVHATFARKVQAWATRMGVTYLNEISRGCLTSGEGSGHPTQRRNYDRMGDTIQCHFQSWLKGFLEWATQIRLIEANPGAALVHISTSKERTYPLTPLQFEQLLAAIEPFCSGRTDAAEVRAGRESPVPQDAEDGSGGGSAVAGGCGQDEMSFFRCSCPSAKVAATPSAPCRDT